MQKRIEYDGLTTHILDLLAPWSIVDARRMFSGCGLFHHGTMFALILDEVLYLKDSLDEQGQPVKTSFEKEYFEYDRQSKTVRLSYFKAPDRALEEGDYLIELAKASYQSAVLKKKTTKSKTKPKSSLRK
jgi:DNA transformation protein and related proteins